MHPESAVSEAGLLPGAAARKATTIRAFAAFDQLMVRVRAWLAGRVVPALGYSREMIADRIAQRVGEIGHPPFAAAIHQRLKKGDPWLPPASAVIDCGGALVHVGSGRFTVRARRFLRDCAEFGVHWLYCLRAISTPRRVAGAPATLVFDMTDDMVICEGSDARFAEYCRQGPIAPLREATRLLIEYHHPIVTTAPDRLAYAPRALPMLLREARLGTAGRARLLAKHLWLPCRYLWALLRMPQVSLIGRELAYTEAGRALDRAGAIEAVVLVCSAWWWQPLWARTLRAPIDMIWYSQSAQLAAYDPDEIDVAGPRFRWMKVDRHWVWTRTFAAYITRHAGPGPRVEAVGPIVWYLPEQRVPARDAIQILVFDVPAILDAVMLEHGGEITNYYTPSIVRGFIQDILDLRAPLEAASGMRVDIVLKMKRGLRPHYSPEYFDYLDAITARGLVSRVPADENLYGLVSASHLVVAFPFTSPAYMAEALGVPAIYYDPTGTLLREDYSDTEHAVRFANGPGELLATAREVLGLAGPQAVLTQQRRTS